MRAPKGWFEWVKLAVSVVLWTAMIGFIATWIYEYDVCRRSSAAASPQAECLVTSVFSAYFTWLAYVVRYFFEVVTVVL